VSPPAADYPPSGGEPSQRPLTGRRPAEPSPRGGRDADHHIALPVRRPYGLLVAVSLLFLLAVGVGFTAFALADRPATVVVPQLVGLDPVAARTAAAGAEVNLLGESADKTVHVVAQEPLAGTKVARGEAIRVVYAATPSRREVPDLHRRRSAEAGEALAAAGLAFGRVREVPSLDDPADLVLRQQPPAGELLPDGGRVDVWLSTPLLVAPGLLGLDEAAAEVAAAEAALALRILYEASDEGAKGTVVLQNPAPGTRLEYGSELVVVISRGPKPSSPDASPRALMVAAEFAPFPVLYPAPAAGFEFSAEPGNPASLAGARGEMGLEVKIFDPAQPGARFTLVEGNGFDPGLDDAAAVRVRGRPGSLGLSGTETVLTWEEQGFRYSVRAEGASREDILRLAEGLQAVPRAPAVE
jgi:beta-lactam-binding protein with PASTA domain